MDETPTPTQEGEPMVKLEKDMAELEKTTPVATAAPQPTSTPTPQPQISPAPQVTGEPPPPPPTDTPGKKNPVLWIAIVLFVLALLAGGVYVVLNTGLLTKEKACTQEVMVCPDGTSVGRVGPNCEFAPCPTPTETPDPTANWETYTNTKYGYSIKYPQDWVPNRGPGNLSDAELASQRDVDFYDPKLPGGDPGTALIIMTNELETTGNDRKCTDLDDCFSKTFNWLTETTTIDKLSSTFLGQPAITFTYQRKTELYIQSWKYIFFIYKGDAYNIHISTNTIREKATFENFDQILSTFKFLEATPSASPTSSPSASPSP